MSSQTFNLHAIIESLPAGSFVVLPDVNWNEYEDLLEQIGESRGVRTSYCDGKLQIMVVSSKHEKYAWFIGRLISTLSLRLRINILFFGAPTMRKEKRRKGLEPDACFYVQSAPLIGNRMQPSTTRLTDQTFGSLWCSPDLWPPAPDPCFPAPAPHNTGHANKSSFPHFPKLSFVRVLRKRCAIDGARVLS